MSTIRILDAEPGELVLIVAVRNRVVNEALGSLRLDVAKRLGMIPEDEYAFAWITEFPLLEYDEDSGHYTPMHHPFTSPIPEDMDKLDSDPGATRAQAYDVVLNGVEIGGGSIRIHSPEVQARMFEVLGIPDEEAKARFGG